jgi:PKD repeat protein
MLRLPRLRNRQRSRGQSIVEFALIAPVLLFLLLITLDFGRLFMSYISLTNTTRVAANFGATVPGAFTGTPDTATYNPVVTRESAGLNCDLQPDSGGHVPPIPTFPNGTGLNGVSVATMTCKFSMFTPFLTNFFGGPLPITASARFPIRTGAIANIGGSTVLPPPGSPQAIFDFTGVSGGTIDGAGNVSGPGSVTVNVTQNSLNAQTWQWSWGDGSPDEFTTLPAAHTFGSPGTSIVTLTVTNGVGSSTRSRTVTVTPLPTQPPIAGFYGTPVAGGSKYVAGGGASGTAISGSLPLVVNFTNQSTNGTAYSWDFGDGPPASTAAAPQHQYTTLGVFPVTLTITAPTGSSPVTRTGYITTGCVVPNFAQTSTSFSDSTYSLAGFPNNSITYHQVGANGNGNKNAPNGKIIQSQSLPGGAFVAATRQGSSWICSGDITVEYLP